MKLYVLTLSCLLLAAPGRIFANSAAAPLIEAYIEQRCGNFEKALNAFNRAIDADPKASETRLSAARLLGKLNRFEEALAILNAADPALPAQHKLLYLKARLFQAQGLLENAAEEAKKAISTKKDSETWKLLLTLLTELKQFEEGKEQAVSWSEAFPKDPDASFALGQILANEDNSEEATTAFRRTLEIDPNHYPAQEGLADLEFQAGNYAGSRDLYKQMIQVNPHDVNAYFKLGQTYHKEDLLEDARDVFLAAGNLGMIMLQSDRYADAAEIYSVMALTRDDGQSWYFLGYSLLGENKFEEAIDAFERVPREASHYQPSLIRRAIALDALERRTEAKELLEEWIIEHPDDEEAAMALSGLFEDDEDYRKAADVLERFVDDHGSENPRLFFTLGVMYDKLKDWRSSADYMKQSIELSPNDAHALNYLGYTYADQGVNLDEAEALITRALQIRSGDGFITDSLGWVYYKQERYDEAVEVLGKAAEMAPDDPIIWEHLGDALSKQGNIDKAKVAYEKTLEIDPEAETAQLKLEKLR